MVRLRESRGANLKGALPNCSPSRLETCSNVKSVAKWPSRPCCARRGPRAPSFALVHWRPFELGCQPFRDGLAFSLDVLRAGNAQRFWCSTVTVTSHAASARFEQDCRLPDHPGLSDLGLFFSQISNALPTAGWTLDSATILAHRQKRCPRPLADGHQLPCHARHNGRHGLPSVGSWHHATEGLFGKAFGGGIGVPADRAQRLYEPRDFCRLRFHRSVPESEGATTRQNGRLLWCETSQVHDAGAPSSIATTWGE